MIKISKIPKFSLNIARGSTETRCKKAEEMTDAFFNEIKDEFVDGKIPLKKIQEKIYKVMPEKKTVKVRKNCDESCLGWVDLCKGKITGRLFYEVNLPTSDSSKKVSILNTETITHEVHHLFSDLFNAKCQIRKSHLINKYACKLMDEFYYSYLYNVGKKAFKPGALEEKIHSLLKDKPVVEKVDILQDWRYFLQDESRTQKIGYKYHKKMLKLHPEMHKMKGYKNIVSGITYGSEYNFLNKIKVIEKILVDTIKNERLAHAKSLKQ